MPRRSERSRIFVAALLGDAAQALAAEAMAHLRSAWRDRPGLRFSPPADLHVTLAFLGELEAERLASVREVVERVARAHAPIEVEVGGLGAFPRLDAARVAWLGFGADDAALAALVADLQSQLRAAGHPLEDRGWTGHVTLARCRSRSGIDARPAFAEGPDRRVPCRVDAMVGMASRASVDGPHYTPIFRALLSGGMQHERV